VFDLDNENVGGTCREPTGGEIVDLIFDCAVWRKLE